MRLHLEDFLYSATHNGEDRFHLSLLLHSTDGTMSSWDRCALRRARSRCERRQVQSDHCASEETACGDENQGPFFCVL